MTISAPPVAPPASAKAGSSNPVRKLWDRLSPLPAGKLLFSLALGRMAPYTGSMGARVTELRPGYAKVQLRDRRRVRNHLNSIHAIALANLGEVSSGIAIMYALPDEARGILTGLSVDYVKKARGTLTAECACGLPDWSRRAEHELESIIRDESGDVVARVRPRWLIGPRSVS
ncbi:MAG: DUF4442 domain-containing protein [Gemmatimonadota bacterium]|nr:DUF4442 domain-containing protein [Gemmatimonadota bacterium]